MAKAIDSGALTEPTFSSLLMRLFSLLRSIKTALIIAKFVRLAPVLSTATRAVFR